MRIEEAAAQNERQDRVVDEIVRGLGLAHDVKVGLVTRGDCCEVEIRVLDGEAVKFVKFEVDDINDSWDWTGQIAAALTGLAQDMGTLSASEEFCFDRADLSSDAIWNFAKVAALDLSEFDDNTVLATNDELPAGKVITTIKIPESVVDWKVLIERLAKRALCC